MVLSWYLTMKTITGSIFKLSIRYLYLRNTIYQYQRKVPKDLLDRYDGTTVIKINLKTASIDEAAKKILILNRQHESSWDNMRANPSITPTSISDAAKKLLALYNLKPLPATNLASDLELFMDLVVEPKREQAAEGDDESYRNISPSDYLSPTEAQALKLICIAPKFNLSEALELYLKRHKKANDQAFITYTTRIWDRLIDILGDKAFEEVNRADANLFIDRILEGGSKTTTARRMLNTVKAVFNTAIVEKELNKSNPFNKIRIAGFGEDAEEREPFTIDELKILSKACIAKDDDMRWMIALQLDLGARVAEIAGLALSDFHLDAEIPYVSIKPHPWRSLKTKDSKRDIPLVGNALWAATRVTESATKGQLCAFPRYTDGKTCNGTGASNALNDWIRARGIDNTTHSFRHSMRDRLRNVNATKEIQDAVGGWGKVDMGEKYGQGYALKLLKEWLDKVVI